MRFGRGKQPSEPDTVKAVLGPPREVALGARRDRQQGAVLKEGDEAPIANKLADRAPAKEAQVVGEITRARMVRNSMSDKFKGFSKSTIPGLDRELDRTIPAKR
jgi:hypothetical protein